MPKLLIGCGLVGSQIARLLLEREEEVVIFDYSPRIDAMREIFDVSKAKIVQGDILNPYDLFRILREDNVDTVIHTAANPLLTLGAQRNPYQAIQINILGTSNVLEAARIMDVKRVVFTSSNVITMYSVKDNYGYLRTKTFYATTKLACELLGFNYMEYYGIEFIVIRFAAVIGPWKYGGGGGPTQRFKELIEKSIRGEKVTFPYTEMEYLYSKDAAKACVLATYSKSLKSYIYEIGMGRTRSSNEIVEIIRKKIPYANVEIVKEADVSMRPITSKPSNLTPAKQELGFEPEYNMEKAIDDYIEWLKKNKYI